MCEWNEKLTSNSNSTSALLYSSAKNYLLTRSKCLLAYLVLEGVTYAINSTGILYQRHLPRHAHLTGSQSQQTPPCAELSPITAVHQQKLWYIFFLFLCYCLASFAIRHVQENFHIFRAPKTPIQRVTRALYPGLTWSGHKADHSPPSLCRA